MVCWKLSAKTIVYCLPGGTIVRPSDRWNRTRRHLRLECRTCYDWRRRGRPRRWWWRGVAGRIWAILHRFAFRRIPSLEFTVKSRGDFFHRTWKLKVLPVTNKSKQHRHQDQNMFTSLLLVTTGYVSLFRCRLCLQVVSQIWTGLETFGTGGEPSLPRRQDLEDDDDVATGGKGTNCWDIEVLFSLNLGMLVLYIDFWWFLNVFESQERSEMQI